MFDENTLNNRNNGDDASSPAGAIAADPVCSLVAERTRLDAIAAEADAAHDQVRTDEIDERVLAIEQTMCRTLATTLRGVLAQMDLLVMLRNDFEPDDDDKFLSVNIRAAIVALIEREGQLG
jgi:hypothetical protein